MTDIASISRKNVKVESAEMFFQRKKPFFRIDLLQIMVKGFCCFTVSVMDAKKNLMESAIF